MGQRGPQKGWKKGAAAEVAAPSTARKPRAVAAPAKPVAAAIQAPAQDTPPDRPHMSAADLENPEKLTGEALRALAHRRGVSRSESAAMSDEKLRLQLRYITNRQYANAED